MNIVIALGVGMLSGIIGVVPYFVARSRIKARMKQDGIGSISTGMVAVFLSFVLMVVQIFLCFVFAREYLLPYGISAIAIFILAMGAYAATLMRR